MVGNITYSMCVWTDYN